MNEKRGGCSERVRIIGAVFGLILLGTGGVNPGASAARTKLDISVVYITRAERPRIPLSLVEPVVTDAGVAGARLAIEENNTTGRFLGHFYRLKEVTVPEGRDMADAFQNEALAGARLFVADLVADDLLRLADLPGVRDSLIFNTRATDDDLRVDACRPNVLHVMPSRAMKADALAQYLVWKRWSRWFLVYGAGQADMAYAAALRRAARKFGAAIIAERLIQENAPSARTDTGHVQIQRQIPLLTQIDEEYDVLVVSDESDTFGEYLPYRTWRPRPVAGTQGLIATAWHRSQEQWGATQIQRRFKRAAGRDMGERDYTAWTAVRAIGEAVTRIGDADAAAIESFLLSDAFKLAAFKGQALSFRPWNGQLRQPILLAAPRSLVSVSPQEGFLHQFTRLDTLGFDRPESRCRTR